MPEYLAPGVFIEEIERGPRPIEGVSTSTAAFLGETERGPTWPRLVTSFNEFTRLYGNAAAEGDFMPYAISGFFENGGRRAYVCRIAGDGAATATLVAGGLRIEANGPGDSGNRIFVKLIEGTTKTGPDKKPVGFRMQVAYWQSLPSGAPPDPFVQGDTLPRPTLIEDFDDLAWDNPLSPDFYEKRLQGGSKLLKVTTTGPLAAAPAADFAPLAGGANGAEPTLVQYRGEADDSSKRSGLAALDLDEFREVALVYAPAAGNDVVKAVYEHCERNRFRFAVIDSPPNWGDVGKIDPRSNWETAYAAFYYPWVITADLQSGARRKVPPGGHVLGLYARTDTERGVWKAPANDVLRGVFDLEYYVEHAGAGDAQPTRRQRHPPVPRPRHPGLGRPHAVVERAVEICQRPAAVHLPRALDLRGHPVGGVRAQRRAAVGPGQGHDPAVPAHAVARRAR